MSLADQIVFAQDSASLPRVTGAVVTVALEIAAEVSPSRTDADVFKRFWMRRDLATKVLQSPEPWVGPYAWAVGAVVTDPSDDTALLAAVRGVWDAVAGVTVPEAPSVVPSV